MLYTGIYHDGYFAEYNMESRQFRRYRIPYIHSVWHLAKDKDNRIWIGGDNGVAIFNPVTKEFLQPLSPKGSPDFFRFSTHFILHGADGITWLATQRGLVKYNRELKTAQCFTYDSTGDKTLKRGSYHAAVYTLFNDSKGNTWFGNAGVGLACYRKTTGEIIYFNDKYPEVNCQSITETKDGSILFTLTHSGVGILEKPFTNKESIRIVNSSNGLPSDKVTRVFRDKRDNIWLFTSDGLCWYEPQTGKLRRFSKEDGIMENLIYSKPYQDEEENIYVGFPRSFQVFNPQKLLTPQKDTGFIHLSSLFVNGKEWPQNLNYYSRLRLNYDQTNLCFNYAFLSPGNTTGYHYAYKLQGLDDDWIEVGDQTFALYNNIAPGKYKLRIKAVNRSGTWSKDEFVLPVAITPPWYQTWWFYSLLTVLVVALLYSLYRYRINQILKLQRIRSQIARDLHDDIGSTLTSISYYSEVVKMQLNKDDTSLTPILDKMGNSARNIMIAMTDIVWIINPQNDTTTSLLNRMRRYTSEMLGERNIQYAFNTSEEIERLKLSMQQRKSLYFIYKEAIHNAVKYAQCSKMEIDFTQTDHQVSLTINDNGKGFDIQNANDGNGLTNMKKRAEEIKADFEISSMIDKGTRISLKCKVT